MLKTRNRENVLVRACLEMKQPFVVDNTNVTAADRARYIAVAKEAGFRVVGYYFQATVREAMRRNSGREGGARVPAAAIAGTQKRLEPPGGEEGFDALCFVSVSADGRFVVT